MVATMKSGTFWDSKQPSQADSHIRCFVSAVFQRIFFWILLLWKLQDISGMWCHVAWY